MEQEKNDLEFNQLINDFNEIETIISKNEDANTEVNHSHEQKPKERQKKTLIRKTKISIKRIRKTPKKLTFKKPKIKSQKTGKKTKSKNSLKNKGKSKYEKIMTNSKELCYIRVENNTLSNSSCQKEYFNFESHKKKDLDISSELEKVSQDIVTEANAYEKDNKVSLSEKGGGIILIKKYEESKQSNNMDDRSSVLSENKNENNICESLPQPNAIRKFQTNPEKNNFNQSENNSEECFNNLELIPSCDEDENPDLFCDINFNS
jgi:hypothetical protein